MRVSRARAAHAAMAAPLLLAVYYAFASWLPARWNAPPAYDMLYLTNYSPAPLSGLQYEIREQRLRFHFVGENTGFGWARLFRFSPATGRVNEVRVMWPREIPPVPPAPRMARPGQAIVRPVPMATDGLKVSADIAAPDGYIFVPVQEGREDLSLLFSKDPGPLLGHVVKDGRRIPLPAPPGPRTSVAVQFVGWVLS